MALKVQRKFRFKGLDWRSGEMYTFRYRAFGEDPEPIVILMYKFSGTHPRTGRQWRFIQALNISYLPRAVRKNFLINWQIEMEQNNGNVYVTWEKIKRQFPMVVKGDCIRRYFYSPNYYIDQPKYVPVENWEEMAISSWHKDFSKKLRMSLRRKYKSAMDKRRQRTDVVGRVLGMLFGKRK